MIAFVNEKLLRLLAAAQTRKLQAEEEGQTLVEYALIIAVVSVMIIGALVTLRGDIEDVFSRIGSALNSGGSS